MKYKIITLGCKVNSYESESYALQLNKAGFDLAKDNESNIDVIIINTCSVTSTSDQKSRQMIHRAHKLNPNAIIMVVGCYSQVSFNTIKDIEGVNIVIGAKYKNKIVELINEYKENKTQIVRVDKYEDIKEYEEMKVINYHDNTRAFLKIQDGCNNFCSYCLIPYTRGRARSRDKDSIIEEANILTYQGFKEIVLTGIHTAGYGLDLKDYNFVDLLKDMLKEIPYLRRIRISSIEESEISDEFIHLLDENHRIVPHLHIPLQSGCDTVLKRMNRKYDTNAFLNTINKIREVLPNIAITTDVIVGFPGESEEEFKQTVEFIKKVNFAMLHVFPYSRRSGTVADKMKDQIDPNIKKERVNTLLDLSNNLAESYIQKYKYKIVEVLFETYDKETNSLVGHAENYFKIRVNGPEELLNSICSVQIIEPNYKESFGVIINKED